jgi:hypothetical protein
VRTKSLHLIGVMALAVATVHSQPTNGPVYWSTVAPDCSTLNNNESPVTITDSAGTTIGYSCYVSGTFLWLAAGGVDYHPAKWGTSIRVAAPASAPIGVNYSFFDATGGAQSMDTTGSIAASSNNVNFALNANQPSEIDLLGATRNSPTYTTTATGSVYAVFYCPDADTCSNVLPQLIYSALPTFPWSLSVPIAWDTQLWTQWSAVGIDDGPGGARRLSLAIYNADQTANTYTVHVYNSAGNLVGTGTTPSIPGAPNAEGGTYGVLLSQIISTALPRGFLKVLVDGGTLYSAVEVLQINGNSATTLQVAFDTAPLAGATAAPVQRSNVKNFRVESTPKKVFSPLQN